MDNRYDQQTSNEIWRLALDVRAAWDKYYSILATIVERGGLPRLTEALTQARSDIESAERGLFNLMDQVLVSANY
jgi:hypothetical protein